MRKWWMGALTAIGCLGASAAAYSQPVPLGGPTAPPPPAVDAGPACNALPPPAPFVAPPPVEAAGGGDRGFDNAFDPPAPGCCPPAFHADIDYLGWWTKHSSLPTLVTQGSIFDPIPGALGQPNTVPLIGGSFDDTYHNGGRLNLGYDCGEDGAWRLQASGFYLQSLTTTTSAGGNGAPNTPVIARPFFNVNTNTQDADPIAVPGVMSGAILIQLPQQVYGGEANVAWQYWSHDAGSWTGSFLAGGRFLSVREQVLIGESLQDVPGLGFPGNSYALNENFSTRNEFYGGQVGASYSWFFGPVTVDVLGKVGFGVTDETLDISGSTTITQPDGTVSSSNRALLVQPSNAGGYHRDVFAVVPELVVDAKYELNDHIRIGGGYDFIYLSRLLRPGDQIDPTVNVQALQPFDQVGPARPGVPLRETSFWMQGFSATLELSF